MLVFLLMLGAVLMLLRHVIDRHAGYMPAVMQTDFDVRARKGFIEEMDGALLRVFVFGFLSALTSFLFDYLKQFPTKGLFYLLEYLWMLDLTLALVFACVLGSTLLEIYREIQNRHTYSA